MSARVLIACECSGVVRRAFTARGHDAWSCDLQRAEDGSNRHIVGDARYFELQLYRFGGCTARVAEAARIDRVTAHRKMQRLGLRPLAPRDTVEETP